MFLLMNTTTEGLVEYLVFLRVAIFACSVFLSTSNRRLFAFDDSESFLEGSTSTSAKVHVYYFL
jgi:hypothetical protein